MSRLYGSWAVIVGDVGPVLGMLGVREGKG